MVYYYKKLNNKLFFKDGKSKEFSKEYDEFCNEYRGVFKISYCDCTLESSVCEKENIKEFPTVKIYPPQPMPAFDVEGELTTKRIIARASP